MVKYGVITYLRTYKAALMRRKRRNIHVCRWYIYIYIVFTSKRLPLQPVSSERNHQVADETGCSGNLFEVKTILFALSIWYRALFGISLTKTLPYIYIYIYSGIYIIVENVSAEGRASTDWLFIRYSTLLITRRYSDPFFEN